MAEKPSVEPGASYPTHDSLCEALLPRGPASIAQQLHWRLDGPLATAISVMTTPSTPPPEGQVQPFFDPDTNTYHPIADLAISDPKVSSITVREYNLENWESDWVDDHGMHTDPPYYKNGEWIQDPGWDILKVPSSNSLEYRAVKRKEPEMEEYLGNGAEWSVFACEEDDPGADDMYPRVLRCCGEARPTEQFSVVVTASGSKEDGCGFVTIRDFVEVVHPWLMNLRREIRVAKGLVGGDFVPLPEETELMVSLGSLNRLWVRTKKEWMSKMKCRKATANMKFRMRSEPF